VLSVVGLIGVDDSLVLLAGFAGFAAALALYFWKSSSCVSAKRSSSLMA
jgi:hypothetical protein